MKFKNKTLKIEKLVNVISKLQNNNKKIVFTNGCFDLIHTGHTRYLSQARNAGDCLVVAVNSDRSVAKIKGDKRPIIPLQERMEILTGFYFVDYVIAFDETDPYNIIKKLRPNILIKGGDWPVGKIIGKDLVEADAGKVFTIPKIPGRSTSDIISTILKQYQANK